ncbi:rhodanese-like domain-containing protein [Pseudalkalibacillus caeni]|uniref:Sulfurtransferase n=1 Tax=Exobacillus caeni TaxID=2574798 RepID=A0A5R9FBT4_9BACL|nr:sulfurtransferase [Pseudalkalibacillus caeni]TLS38014.1 sulfurtransferase [Pseudalkalibacillus caeni]
MSILFSFAAVAIGYFLYKRYLPLHGVQTMNLQEIADKHLTVIDIRDYNVAASMPLDGAYNLPYAYMKRHYGEIPAKSIVLASCDLVSKNLCARFLKKHGFKIVGYYEIKDPSSGKMDRQVRDYSGPCHQEC